MTIDRDQIFTDLLARLEAFNKAGVTLTAATDIAADLSIDSVAVMDLIMEIEDKYDISIPMNALSEMRTIGDLVQAVVTAVESG